MRSRYYDVAIGRFLSRDPDPGSIESPETLTGFLYARNNPVLLTDPSGKSYALLAIGLGAATGAAIATGGYWGTCGDFCNVSDFAKAFGYGAVVGGGTVAVFVIGEQSATAIAGLAAVKFTAATAAKYAGKKLVEVGGGFAACEFILGEQCAKSALLSFGSVTAFSAPVHASLTVERTVVTNVNRSVQQPQKPSIPMVARPAKDY